MSDIKKMDSIIKKLRQNQQLEKIASDEAAPETASATQQLIERLKQPRQQQTDLRPLFALASPSVGQRLLQASNKPSAFSQQEERLAKAANLEDQETKKLLTIARLTAGNTGNPEKDMAAIEKASSLIEGQGRGGTSMRKAWDNIKSIDKLKSMAEDFQSGQLTFDAQSNMEYSSAISALITNRAPGIEVIRETAYKHFGGDINAMTQYMTGHPKDALSKEMMGEISRQIYNIERSEKHALSKKIARMFNAYRGRFKRSPESAQLWKEQYGHIADFDLNEMKASPKKYDSDIETRLGKKVEADKEVKVQSPDGQFGTIPAANLDAAIQAGYQLIEE